MKEFNFLLFHKLLPKPEQITDEDCDVFWKEFNTFFIELLEKEQYQTLIKLFSLSKSPIKLFCKKIDPSIHKEIVLRLYKIITTIPVLSYGLVYEAAEFMATFLFYKPVKDITVEWKPLYKMYRYITIKSPSSFVVESDDLTSNLFKIMGSLNSCYPVGTMDQLFTKFLPKIAPHAVDSTVYLTMISKMLPQNDNSFQKWLPNIRDLLIDYGSLIQLIPLVSIFNTFISKNTEYDFNDFLTPIVVNLCSILLTQQGPGHLSYEFSTVQFNLEDVEGSIPRLLARSLVYLMVSPPTREQAIEKMKLIMESAQTISKDSSSSDDKFTKFIFQTLSCINSIQRKSKDDATQLSLKFTDEQLHTILMPIVDTLICLLKSLNITRASATIKSIRLIMNMDTSFTPRFYEFADLCISYPDAQAIGYIGWNIMSAIMADITQYDFLLANMGRIFEIAISNFYRSDTQRPLTHAIYTITSLIPFNHVNGNPAVDYVDFTGLTERFIMAYLDIISRLPAFKGKQAPIDASFCELIRTIFDSIFQDGEPTIFTVLKPIIFDAIQDTSYSHVLKLITSLVAKYFENVPIEIYNEGIELFKNCLRTRHDVASICYILHLFGIVSTRGSKCADDVRKITAVILPLTQHQNKKVKKCAYKALAFAITPWACTPITTTINAKQGEFRPISEFTVHAKEKFDVNDVALECFNPLFDYLLTETDANKVTSAIRPALYALQALCDFIFDISEGDLSMLPIATRISYFNGKEYTKKSIPFKDKFMKVIIRLMRDFPDNPLLMRKLIPTTSNIFIPMIALTFNVPDSMDQLSAQFWPCERENNLAVKSIITPIVKWLHHRRMTSHLLPATDLIKQFFSALLPLATSRYKPIRAVVREVLACVGDFYSSVYSEEVFKIVEKSSEIPTDEFIDFMTIPIIFSIISSNSQILCHAIYRVLSQFDIKDQESIISFRQFLTTNCVRAPNYDKCDVSAFNELLDKIQNLLLTVHVQNKIFHHIILLALIIILRNNIQIPQFFQDYILDCASSPDSDTASNAYLCIIIMFKGIPLEQVKKPNNFTPKLESFPDIIGSCQLAFNDNCKLSDIVENVLPDPIDQVGDECMMQMPSIDEIVMMLREQGVPEEQIPDAVDQVMEQMQQMIISQQQQQHQSMQMQIDMQMQMQGIDPDKMTDEQVLAVLNGEQSVHDIADNGCEMEIDEGELGEQTMIYNDGSMSSAENDKNAMLVMSNDSDIGVDGVVMQQSPTTVIDKIYEAIENMELYWDEPNIPSYFYSQSAGWNFYPKNEMIKKFPQNTPDVAPEAILRIINSFCAVDSEKHVVIQSFPILMSYLAMTFTEEIVDLIADHVKKLLSYNLSVFAIPTFAYLLQGVSLAAPKLDFQIYKRFVHKVALPIICACSLNLQFAEQSDGIFLVMFSEQIMDYASPLINLLFEYSTISPNDSTIITRSFFNHLNTIFCSRPTSFFVNFDLIVDKFLHPFFSGLNSFNRSINSEFACLFVMLVESTCIRQSSALYSPILEEKRNKLINEFDDAFSKINTSNKNAQGVIIVFLSYVSMSSVMAVEVLAPIILKHQRIILMASNQTDEETEDAIFSTILNFTMHQYFLYRPDLLVDYIDLIIGNMNRLSLPLQMKMIFHILTIITMDAFAFNSKQYDHFYDIMLKFISECTNENLKGEALAVLGRIMLATKKKTQLNELTAAAVLNAALIFDECDQIIIDAFEVVKDKLEGKSANKTLLKDSVSLFWKQHSFSVTPKVEAMLEPYRTLVPPSYIT
ncbi:hypothetical protein TVAG_327980 [Trichomonas vaginalis G3]|uniref:Uncharacterized protein n=1 Tax=Trichomonas vaginalis (strain ATCC PRA-98 / G3) TaxID=412133 RepID=A2FKX1_TRIV3|nr:armadillo (ARM) repeat-containing protein family [Trichomonas vaginalis G3]EAX94455.1 hypothetical protein TVAG_327980 [Trichomonas vaginalis G3]KAI5528604.1 armadillo (ARM) repeat-containing protein family [Trichomonas vaginalis G3]|eukprot:XP_001307385.1 hypothetical protein [Trichomonas vaginalis G3]